MTAMAHGSTTIRLTKNDGTVIDLPIPFSAPFNARRLRGIIARAILVDDGAFSVSANDLGNTTQITVSTNAGTVTLDLSVGGDQLRELLAIDGPLTLAALPLE
jgi:hypothetical protein